MLGRRQHFFFAGDTGYYPALFKEIGQRLAPFDVAAIPIGAYLPAYMMKFVHSTPEHALQILSDVRATQMLAMHWGTFDLADEPIGEPPRRLEAEAYRLGLDEKRVWSGEGASHSFLLLIVKGAAIPLGKKFLGRWRICRKQQATGLTE